MKTEKELKQGSLKAWKVYVNSHLTEDEKKFIKFFEKNVFDGYSYENMKRSRHRLDYMLTRLRELIEFEYKLMNVSNASQLKRKKDKISQEKAEAEKSCDWIGRAINLGEHCSVSYHRANINAVLVKEDTERYSSRCKFLKVTRNFHIYIKKGYSARVIGGVFTFIRDKEGIKREGIPVEWVEQEKSLSKITRCSGYLVRGEHIRADNLKEAQRKSKERRDKIAAKLRAARMREQKKIKKMENVKITFNDSLASGNCRPGTLAFKQKVEAHLGHEITELSAANVLKYGKMFNVEYYARRVVNYLACNRK